MPVSAYFGGKGKQVMADMKDRYGAKDGERTFYAVANKQKKAKTRRAAKRGSLMSGEN